MSNKIKKNKSLSVTSREIATEKTAIEKTIRAFSARDIFIPRHLIPKLHKLEKNKKRLNKSQKDEASKLRMGIAMLYGIENGMWAGTISHGKYLGSLTEIRRKIVEDYGCKTSVELMLADRITANYWRAMRIDTQLNHMEDEDGSISINQLNINMSKELNAGLERADRQLNADIMLLKELKQPKLNIKVNTENTYIAQNQQVINNKNESKSIVDKSLEADNLGKI
jgi:hypothetical protein